MKVIKVMLRNLLVLVFGIVLGVLLLWGTFFLPEKAIDYHVELSSQMLKEEGMYPMLIKDHAPGTLDNFTDAIMLSEALTKAPHGEELYYAMMAFYEVSGGAFPTNVLAAHFEGGETASGISLSSYGRYWHGYLVPLKLLLTRFSLQQIRFLNIAAHMMLLFFLLYLLSRKGVTWLYFPILLGVLCIYPAGFGLSLQFSSSFYVAFIAAAGYILSQKKLECVRGGILTFFMIVGMVTAYLDFLTYPVYTLGIPLGLAIMLDERTVTLKSRTLIFIGSTFHWALGYGAFWGSKWVVGSLLTGEDLVSGALEVLELHSSSHYGRKTLTYGEVIQRNWEALNSNPACRYLMAAFILFCLIFIIIQVIRGQRSLREVKKAIIYACPQLLVLLLPFGWFFATKEHSYRHSWFTFRDLGVALFAVSAFFAEITFWNRPKEALRE